MAPIALLIVSGCESFWLLTNPERALSRASLEAGQRANAFEYDLLSKGQAPWKLPKDHPGYLKQNDFQWLALMGWLTPEKFEQGLLAPWKLPEDDPRYMIKKQWYDEKDAKYFKLIGGENKTHDNKKFNQDNP